MTADDILVAARSCLGAPFRHQGRDPATGIDCAGLIVVVARSLGVPVADVSGYGVTPMCGQLEAALDAQSHLSRLPERLLMRPGDVLLIRFAGEPQHLAVLGDGTLIHCYETSGKCVEHDFPESWRRRVVAAYRFAGIA